MAWCDARGRFLETSRALHALLGLDAHALEARSLMDVLRPSFVKPGTSLEDELARSPGGVFSIERRHRRPDGELRWVRLSASMARWSGEERRILALFEDVTDKARAQEKLAEQASLIDEVPGAIMAKNMEDRVTFWSAGAERLYGWAAAEVMGRSAGELFFRDRPDALAKAEREALSRGAWCGQLEQVAKNGAKLVVESRWSVMRDAGGTPTGILVIDTDVTEKTAIEAQLIRTQRLESIGLLAGGIAHDINNILTPILMAAGLLRRKPDEETVRRLLQTIENKVQLGAGLVRQILHFARGINGERTPLQPRHLVLELEKFARDTFPRNIVIRSDVPKELWPVCGDTTQLYQVLMNLCVNARDAMEHGGQLDLGAQNVVVDELFARTHPEARAGSFVVLTVTDTGTGIPPHVLERMFEPFFTTKDVGKGTGLGLSTTLGIVKSHGGWIMVTSEPGRGTAFRVYLPASEGAPVASAAAERGALPMGHGECVLIVDDEPEIRDVARTVLETHGYRVITAGDGTEAIAIYAANRGQVDLVLVDMAMPYMDGAATIRALRKLDPAVRLIATSGLHDEDGGPDTPFVPKPFSAETLLTSVADVIAGK
jgi:two-component system cell cycle sensor histidine kinase/response regulator CckA